MPIREYQCPKCKAISEHLLKHNEDLKEMCKICNVNLNKLVSVGGFRLKGDGWPGH